MSHLWSDTVSATHGGQANQKPDWILFTNGPTNQSWFVDLLKKNRCQCQSVTSQVSYDKWGGFINNSKINVKTSWGVLCVQRCYSEGLCCERFVYEWLSPSFGLQPADPGWLMTWPCLFNKTATLIWDFRIFFFFFLIKPGDSKRSTVFSL